MADSGAVRVEMSDRQTLCPSWTADGPASAPQMNLGHAEGDCPRVAFLEWSRLLRKSIGRESAISIRAPSVRAGLPWPSSQGTRFKPNARSSAKEAPPKRVARVCIPVAQNAFGRDCGATDTSPLPHLA
jgi:hypothetical protein